jgi:hypothetical protein
VLALVLSATSSHSSEAAVLALAWWPPGSAWPRRHSSEAAVLALGEDAPHHVTTLKPLCWHWHLTLVVVSQL